MAGSAFIAAWRGGSVAGAVDGSGLSTSAAGSDASWLASAGVPSVAALRLLALRCAGLAVVARSEEVFAVGLAACSTVSSGACSGARVSSAGCLVAVLAAALAGAARVAALALPAEVLPGAGGAVLARFCPPARAAGLAGASSEAALLRATAVFAEPVVFVVFGRAAGSASADPRAGAAFLAAGFLAVALLVAVVFDVLFDLGVLIATVSGLHTLRRAAGRQ
ncbi:MAG TPA: hypothetical protein VNM90_28090 [Haliangium sp.]|nr:hypothetical protein [Haliangium sp.]